MDATSEARQRALEEMLMTPCCWSESLRRHRSPEALQMKAEIAKLIAKGLSDGQIMEQYKRRYGSRILTEPEGRQWWVLQLIPLVFIAVGLVFTLIVMRRWRRAGQALRERSSVR
jgi:cytochrome c-type biogenesis protein CcmH